jgi:hypothetical protein
MPVEGRQVFLLKLALLKQKRASEVSRAGSINPKPAL